MRSRTALLLAIPLLLAGCAGAADPGPGTGGAAAGSGQADGAAAPVATVAPIPDCAPDGDQGGPYEGWPVPGRAQASGDLIPYIVSTQIVAGPARVLLTLVDQAGAVLAGPEVAVHAAFYDLAGDPATPAAEADGLYVEAVPGRGLYSFAVDLRCAGDWGIEIAAALPAGTVTSRVMTSVLPAGTIPRIGSEAPRSLSATGTTPEEIRAISTDDDPDPDFYPRTIAQAVTSGRPSVILFATPMFCQTAACGPTLDVVKGIARDYKDRIVFVHVEPYALRLTDMGIQPDLDANGQLQPVPATVEWGLPTEPYLFVVDAAGRVASSFEGVMGTDELRAAFEAVLVAEPSPGASPAG
jgi:hypothetical protein